MQLVYDFQRFNTAIFLALGLWAWHRDFSLGFETSALAWGLWSLTLAFSLWASLTSMVKNTFV